jgi:hypothetical protein
MPRGRHMYTEGEKKSVKREKRDIGRYIEREERGRK